MQVNNTKYNMIILKCNGKHIKIPTFYRNFVIIQIGVSIINDLRT